MEKSAKRAIMILSIVVVTLALVLIYALAVAPAINGYATKVYNQGYVQGISDVAKTVSQSGYVQIPLANNKSIVLVPYQAPTQTTQQAQTQTTPQTAPSNSSA